MKIITVRTISLNDYNTLTEAGYKINFHNPKSQDTKTYGVGSRIPKANEIVHNAQEITTQVGISTLVPYVLIKDRK